MNVKPLHIRDYDTLISWWRWWRFPAPSLDMLPLSVTGDFEGTMIYDGNIPVCAGFIYRTVTNIAWMEFIVSNPEYKSPGRAKAIHLLIVELTLRARELGHSIIYTSVNNENLIRHLESAGFKKGSQTTEMIVVL